VRPFTAQLIARLGGNVGLVHGESSGRLPSCGHCHSDSRAVWIVLIIAALGVTAIAPKSKTRKAFASDAASVTSQ
jgi:hypothetical protein